MTIHRLSIIIIFLLSISTFINNAFANQFSNTIVFGDSISDIGNMPMTSTLHSVPSKPMLRSTNFYVPVSNPVLKRAQQRYHLLTQPSIYLTYPAIQANTSYLPIQPPINGKPRRYRSIGWSQYFVTDILGPKAVIVPSMLLHKIHPSLATSVNYSFVSAMTVNTCPGWLYAHPRRNCTFKQVEQTNQHYMQLTRHGIDRIALLRFPGLLKQVRFFQQDLQHHRVVVNQNTRYLIMFGGNDINFAYIHAKSKSWSDQVKAMKTASKQAAQNTASAVSELVNGHAHAKHIVLFTLFDMQYVPALYNTPTARRFFAAGSKQYSQDQQALFIKLKRRYPKIDIRLFDLYGLSRQLAKSSAFHKTLGQSCDENHTYYTSAANSHNCYIGSKQAYLFWNAHHFSSPFYQILAYRLKQLLTQ